MCRFVLYLGVPIRLEALVTKPSNSLIHQSYDSKERTEPLNGDGFGIAWYAHEHANEPALFRSVTPAWNNHNLGHLARVTSSTCVLAHVRAATPGLMVSENNCHPFVSGQFAFMHNGHVGGFRQLKREFSNCLSDQAYSAIQGSTDSEHMFALFLDQYQKQNGKSRSEAIGNALYETVRMIVELTRGRDQGEGNYLNFAVSDGHVAAVTRFTTEHPSDAESLHYHYGKKYVCVGDTCKMVDAEEAHNAVLVSSERLSDDEGWQTVPSNHLVVVTQNRSVQLRALEF